jgi:predicted methyltransferase
MGRRSFLIRVVVFMAVMSLGYVAWEAALTLMRLEQVERARDDWQRPQEVIEALGVKAGDTVVDLGSGSGYFAIRLAPAVGPAGQVIAVDVQRQPLAFLWVRRLLRRDWQIQIVLGKDDNPRLRVTNVDAVLMANTFHELNNPPATLKILRDVMKPQARLVVADRRPRGGPGLSAQAERERHTLSPATAEAEIIAAGFERVTRDDVFIDRPGDEPWWLLVFTMSASSTSPAGAADRAPGSTPAR